LTVWLWQFGHSSWRFSSPVVIAVTVDVVERQRQRAAAPALDSAHLTAVVLEAQPHQPVLDVSTTSPTGEQLIERHRRRTRMDQPPLPRLMEGPASEPEVPHAVRDAVPLVVVALNRRPVVATGEARIGRHSKPPKVVADGGLGQREADRDLRRPKPFPS
jgi:hypothetical protein